MTDGLKNLTTKAAFNGLTATASVGMKKLNKICLEETTDAELHPQVQRYKQQNPLDWVVRHCSPDTVFDDSRFADSRWNQSNSASQCAGRTVVDWCRIRLEDNH